jgi:SEC-C motif
VATIPAVCESCGELFVSHNATGGKATTAGEGDRVGPCPTCGARWGRVIDGTHELAEELARYLGGADIGPEALRSMQSLLEGVRDGTLEPDVAAEDIRDKIPDAAGIAWLVSARGPSQETWLALLSAIVALLADGDGNTGATLSAEQIEHVVRDIEGGEPDDVSAEPPRPAVSAKVARNAPCPCGSGDKYKRCHGRQQAAVAAK